jgi:antitoxin component YwqK of YwqJK toxin-antitoxin module
MKSYILLVVIKIFAFNLVAQQPAPKNVCNDKYGNEISNSKFESEFFETEGLKHFKKYLLKYYPDFVESEGGVEKLDKATVNDCMLIRLFYTGDPNKNYYAIGDLIYPDWKKYVGGYINSDSKSKEEFDKWKKGGDEGDNTDFSVTDWQTLIDNGQISNKGIIRKINNTFVLVFKYNDEEKKVLFDDIRTDNKLDFRNMIKNINDGTYSYSYLKPPVKNDDPKTKSLYPLKSKRYVSIVKYDSNNDEYLSFIYDTEVGIKAPKINSESNKTELTDLDDDEKSYLSLVLDNEDLKEDSLGFNGLVISSKLLDFKNDKYYYKNIIFNGFLLDFFESGQIESKTQIKNGEINGKIEIYFLDEKYNSKDYFDSNYCKSLKSELNESLKSLNASIQDSILKSNQLKDYVFNSIKGYEKLAKLRTKYLNNTLKGKKLELYNQYVELEKTQIGSSKNLSEIRNDIIILKTNISNEEEKSNYLPIKQVIYYQNGATKNGSFRSFYPNQKLKEKGQYLNNLQNGTWEYYYKNGILKGIGQFSNGNGEEPGTTGIPRNGRIGLWKTYYENGIIFQEQNFRVDKKVYIKTYFKNGKIKQEGEYDKFEKDLKPLGLHILYRENGKKIQEVDYLSDDRSKVEKNYFENGQIFSVINYVDSIYHGKVIHYREDGKIEKESSYKFGKLNGLVKSYFPNGNLHIESNFCNNQQQGLLAEYYENGKIKLKAFTDTTAALFVDSELRLFGDVFYYNEDGTINAHYYINKDGTNTDKLIEEKKLQNPKKKFKYINNSKSTCKWCKKSVYCEKREQWELDYWKNLDPLSEVFFDIFNKAFAAEQEYQPEIDLYNCPDFCSPKCEYESKKAGY